MFRSLAEKKTMGTTFQHFIYKTSFIDILYLLSFVKVINSIFVRVVNLILIVYSYIQNSVYVEI